VGFVGISSSPHDSPEEVAQQMEELGLEFSFLRDADQELLRQLDVRTSTEVVVLDRERRVCYRGAVADRLDVGVRGTEGDGALGSTRRPPLHDWTNRYMRRISRYASSASRAV